MDHQNAKLGISFIVPTLNRCQWVKRAIDSCLACAGESVQPHVIVIESQSDDGTFKYLERIYGRDPRVTLRQNGRSTGCVESWLQGAEMVKTPLAGFLFDDDVLSPFFKDMVACMVRHGCNFAMGFGAVHSIHTTHRFGPLERFESFSGSELLPAYFGRESRLNRPDMPVSPICCAVSRQLLHEWIQAVRVFAAQNSLRRYFMLQRGIGPDLMLYLAAILEGEGPLLVTRSAVAQFSAHPGSISVKARSFDLSVGYWLAKVWAFDRIAEAGHKGEAGACAGYLLLNGLRLVFMNLARGETTWVLNVLSELRMLCGRIIKAQVFWAALVTAAASVERRIKRRARK